MRAAISETIVQCLLARAGVIALPTSSREECSPWYKYNHDVAVPMGEYKKPISIKYGKGGSSSNKDIYCQRVASGLGEVARTIIYHSEQHEQHTRLARRFMHRSADIPRLLSEIIAEDLAEDLPHTDQRAKILTGLGEHITTRLQQHPVFNRPKRATT